MGEVLVAAVTTLGVVVSAWFAYRASTHSKSVQREVASGNGKSTGTYITDIDTKLDRILEKQGALGARIDLHEQHDDEKFDELRRLIGVGA